MFSHFIRYSLMVAALTIGPTLLFTGWTFAHLFDIDPNAGGINYDWTLTHFELGDEFTLTGYVGSCSFRDPALADQPMLGDQDLPAEQRGWTHTSDWLALEVADRSAITITHERGESFEFLDFSGNSQTAHEELVPAFAIYEGWDNDKSAYEDVFFGFPPPPEKSDDWHVFNNSGNMLWAEDLNFLTNAEDTLGTGSLTRTYILDPGEYSIVLSGFVGPDGTVQSESYQTHLTAAPVASTVPEPSTLSLLVLGLLGLGFHSRKKLFK